MGTLKRFSCRPPLYTQSMRYLVRSGLLVASLSGVVATAEAANYGRDPTAHRRWLELLATAPEDQVVVKSFALRLGLCTWVDQGLLMLDQTTASFEAERMDRLIQRHPDQQSRPAPAPGTAAADILSSGDSGS